MLRLIDNDTLQPEDVDPIMEQLDYLLEQMVDGACGRARQPPPWLPMPTLWAARGSGGCRAGNHDEVDSIDDDAIYEELGLEEANQPPPPPRPPPRPLLVAGAPAVLRPSVAGDTIGGGSSRHERQQRREHH